MTKFCTKCGRKLEKEEKCTCEKIKKEENLPKKEDIFSRIGTFLKTPVDCLKDNNFLNGNEYLILFLTSLSFGLINAIMPCFIPTRVFLSTTIISFLFFLFLSFLISFVRSTIYQKEKDYGAILKIISTSSIILLVTNIIAFLFSFLSFFYVIILILFGFLLFILYSYHGLLNLNDNNQNSIAYEITISLFLTIILLLLGMAII